uniref:Large ribosomal subunit protein bL33c n=1 Tax=Laurenciella marilzae TaxID=1413812 RepID=A0A1Z1M1X9_9FLOR|nr:ribosomal protein L33 [Laurenciella marilzae]ARW59795.1 ribosomal protein L33 [Laurenciella marilzae]
MGKNKGSRIIITLECACNKSRKVNTTKITKSISRYTTSKNKRNTPNKLTIKKFCSHCNCHSIFKEIK